MAVLVHLARHAGEVVTRNEFADEVWRGRVVSDEVLSRDISILRSQLGDDAKDPDYVLTIPRVGYRLINKVGPLKDPDTEPTLSPEIPSEQLVAPVRSDNGVSSVPTAPEVASPVRLWRERRNILLSVIVLVALAALITTLLWPR